MKEALYYDKHHDGKVLCQLCPRGCLISEGHEGLCGVRGNRGGVLYALTYGKTVSAAFDPIEKKPLNHFYPGSKTFSLGSVGCNMRCLHCQNWQISHLSASGVNGQLTDLSPQQAVSRAKAEHCRALVWTYNEPSIWIEYVLDSAKLARQAGLQTVLVTSGMINPAPLQDLLQWTDAYRLDIKGFSEDCYQRLTGSRVLKQVLDNAKTAYDSGAHVEIVTNIIPNWNDSDEQLHGLSRWIVGNLSPDVPWHVTRYYPCYKMTEPATPITTLERARQIGMSEGLNYVYVGNVPGHSAEKTRCPDCGRLLIDRSGYQIVVNHIEGGACKFCGCRIGHYRGD
ncbi:MAG: AmmeMemoRadiSam system radical SAM enzyme [Desulfuromonadales bacterium]|nr:AmmeMemoRadiSam system radical SAM enzyme [Desulfuromonadales bacterium]